MIETNQHQKKDMNTETDSILNKLRGAVARINAFQSAHASRLEEKQRIEASHDGSLDKRTALSYAEVLAAITLATSTQEVIRVSLRPLLEEAGRQEDLKVHRVTNLWDEVDKAIEAHVLNNVHPDVRAGVNPFATKVYNDEKAARNRPTGQHIHLQCRPDDTINKVKGNADAMIESLGSLDTEINRCEAVLAKYSGKPAIPA